MSGVNFVAFFVKTQSFSTSVGQQFAQKTTEIMILTFWRYQSIISTKRVTIFWGVYLGMSYLYHRQTHLLNFTRVRQVETVLYATTIGPCQWSARLLNTLGTELPLFHCLCCHNCCLFLPSQYLKFTSRPRKCGYSTSSLPALLASQSLYCTHGTGGFS